MRSIIISLVALLCAGGHAYAYGYGIEPGSKIQATRASASDASIYRVWAVDDGNVVSRYDLPLTSGGSKWTFHGNGGSAASTVGVAATSYISGSSIVELVFYVGADTNLYMGTSIDRGAITWTVYAGPPGQTLTGKLAVETALVGGARYIMLGGYATANHFYRWVRMASGGTATWTDTGVNSWVDGFDLAVTKNPSETIVSFFAVYNPSDPSVAMIRWNPSSWSVWNYGHPTGAEHCVSMAAIQGPFTTTGITYRISMGCTNGSTKFHILWGTSDTTTSLSWASYNLSTTVAAGYNSVGAIRPGTFAMTLTHEFFTTLSSLQMTRISVGSTSATVADLGEIKGIDSLPGGMTIAPHSGASRVFYLGTLSAATRMFERRGAVSNNFADHRWLNSTNLLHAWPSPPQAAEGKLSSYHGTDALSVIEHPGPGTTDFASVSFMFSNNQNEVVEFSKSKQVTNIVNISGSHTYDGDASDNVTHQYVSDPTTVVTDDKVAYSLQLGVGMHDTTDPRSTPECSDTDIITRTTIYMVSTTDGLTHSAPILVGTRTNSMHAPPMDHPWADIQHVPSGGDIIHIVWWEPDTGDIWYRRYTQGVGLVAAIDLGHVPGGQGGPPRVTANDSGRVLVYYGENGSVQVCELNGTGTNCTFPPGSSGGWAPVTGYWSHDVVTTGSHFIRNEVPMSLAVSEADSSAANFCVDVEESNLTNSDVRCGRITRDASGTWAVSGSSIVNAVANDSKDQFMAETATTAEDDAFNPAQDNVVVTWYDRANSSTNFAYDVMKAVSVDGGVTYSAPLLASGNMSDPERLPRICWAASGYGSDIINVRFIGDFHAAEGDRLYATFPAVVVPPGTFTATLISGYPMGLGAWSNQ